MMINAAVMRAPGSPVQIERFPEPVLAPGETLISTIYSEVCGTDVHLKHGRLAGVPYPIIPGHISVGRVERTRGVVRYVDGAQVGEGDIVTFFDVHNICNHCWHCLVAKTSTKCPERRVYGVTHSSHEGLMGGWSQKILLRADVKIIRLPSSVSPLRMIAGGCALPTALHAIERAEVSIGETVVVQGAGPVGLSAAILARQSGAQNVFIIDRSTARLEVAGRFGFSNALVINLEHPTRHIEAVLDATGGRGADVVIEATGAPAALKEGLAMARDGGRYIIVGHYTDTGEVSINPHTDINRKHLDIRGTWGIDFSHFYRMIEVLKPPTTEDATHVSWEDMIGKVYALKDVNLALDDVECGRIVKAVINPNGI